MATFLTDDGITVSQQSASERQGLLNRLCTGEEIGDYVRGGSCYLYVVFCKYLNDQLSADEFATALNGDDAVWINMLGFDRGTMWTAGQQIPQYSAVGFWDGTKWFHGTLCAGGNKLRGTNAHGINAGWADPFDANTLVPNADPQYAGWFEHPTEGANKYLQLYYA